MYSKNEIRFNIRSFHYNSNCEELCTILPTYPDEFSRNCIIEIIDELEKFHVNCLSDLDFNCLGDLDLERIK